MAANATVSLQIDLKAFNEGLKTALRMGEAFGTAMNGVLTGKMKLDTAGLDRVLKEYQERMKTMGGTEIKVDTTQAVAGVQKLAAETQKAETQTKTSALSIRDSFAMWGLAIQGAERMIQIGARALDSLTRPAMEAEDAQEGLRASLRQTGKYTEELTQQIIKYSAEIQKKTRYEDDSVTSGVALMQSIGNLSAEQIPLATKAAIGIAAAYRKDLPEAFMILGKAAQGSFATIGRMGIVLEEGLSPQEKFNKLLEIGAGKFSIAEAAAKTMAGQIESNKNRLSDLMELLGQTVFPLISGVLTIIKPIVLWLTNMNGVMRVLVITSPLLALAWYSLAAAAAASGTAVVTFSTVLGVASLAVSKFLLTMGPVGWTLMGITAVVTALSFVFKKAETATNSLADASVNMKKRAGEITASAQGEVAGFNALIGKLTELRKEENLSAEKKTELKTVITLLNDKYGSYLHNLDLERASLNDVASAARNAANAMIQKKVAEGYGEDFEKSARKIADLKREFKKLTGEEYTVGAVLRLGAKWQADYNNDMEKYAGMGYDAAVKAANAHKSRVSVINEQISAELRNNAGLWKELQNQLANMPDLFWGDTGGGGSEGGGGAAGANLIKGTKEYYDAVRFLDADYYGWKKQQIIDEVAAYQISDAEKVTLQKKLVDELDAEQAKYSADQQKEAEERSKRVREELERQAASIEKYYNEVKFLDAGYYDWKKMKIEFDVAALKLSAEQSELILKERIAALDAEKKAWEDLPFAKVVEQYQQFKDEMADSKTIGIAQWAAIRDGLIGFRDLLLQFGDDPAVQKVLKQLSGEIDVATMNAAGKKGNWFWNKLLGFDPNSDDDKAQISRIQDTLSTISNMAEDVVNRAIDLEERRKQKELDRIDAVAKAQKWSDERTIAEKEKINKKFEQEEKKYRNAQKAMSIVNAGINTAEGITKALALEGPLGIISAALIGAMGAAQIAFIADQEFWQGGHTGFGGDREVAGTVHRNEIVFEAGITKKNLNPLLALRGMLQKGYNLIDLMPSINLSYMPVPVVKQGFAYAGGGYTGNGGGYEELKEEIRELGRVMRSLEFKAKFDGDMRGLSVKLESAGRDRMRT